jgi:hypothetical protein
MTMNKLLPAIAIASLAFSGAAFAQGAIGGGTGSDSVNIQDEANSNIPYAPREPKTMVPVISNPGQVLIVPVANPAPGFLAAPVYRSDRDAAEDRLERDRRFGKFRTSETRVITSPRGLTKLKGPVLDAYGNHVYASEEVQSSSALD